MKPILTLIVSIALLSACSNSASSTHTGGKGIHSQERSTAFKSMMPNFSTMGKIVKGEEPYHPEPFKQMAAAFAAESQEPFKHFTQDANGETGDALPNIWTDAAGFAAAEKAFHEAVAKLNAAAQTGDLAQIKVAYGEVGGNCKSCHDTYRRPK